MSRGTPLLFTLLNPDDETPPWRIKVELWKGDEVIATDQFTWLAGSVRIDWQAAEERTWKQLTGVSKREWLEAWFKRVGEQP